jgi:hypothetical protein|nr:MAG TPA: hypothetical protein [Caudoviricetes sp.]
MTLPSGTTASRAKENTTMRQKIKSKWDKKCRYEVGTSEPLPRQFSLEGANFSSSLKTEGENWCRLIDEGVVVDNGFFTGEPMAYAVIRKGVLKKWYESLTDDFVGTIDKDHNRSIDLGLFTKKDLRLVELEDGRYAIDVNVKLDQELYAVKDLLKMNNRTALSVEMFVNADEYATAEKVTGDESQGKYLVPLIDDLKIEGYAVCLAPKSANSYKDGLLENAGSTDINLIKEKEFSMKKNEELKAPALEQVDASAGPDVEVTTEVAETEAVETPAVEATEVEPAEPAEEAEQEVKEEAVSEEEDKLSAIEAEIKNLKAENASLKEENADLKAQLTVKAEKAFATEERLTSILAMAASDAPTADEGGKTTPEEEKNKTEEVDAYTAAFAELNKEQ